MKVRSHVGVVNRSDEVVVPPVLWETVFEWANVEPRNGYRHDNALVVVKFFDAVTAKT